jgi:hypothetical protein
MGEVDLPQRCPHGFGPSRNPDLERDADQTSKPYVEAHPDEERNRSPEVSPDRAVGLIRPFNAMSERRLCPSVPVQYCSGWSLAATWKPRAFAG